MVIWKQILQPGITRFEDWPTGTEILCVDNQNNAITMWFKKPTLEVSTTLRAVVVVQTGEVFEFPAHTYIGTVLLSGGTLVYHVFEITTPDLMPSPSVLTFVKIQHLLKQRRIDAEVRPDNADFCKVSIRCHMCNGSTELRLPFMGLYKWFALNLVIQDALPEVEPEQRELLISGTCSACFNALFKSEDAQL